VFYFAQTKTHEKKTRPNKQFPWESFHPFSICAGPERERTHNLLFSLTENFPPVRLIINNDLRKSLQSSSVVDYENIGKSWRAWEVFLKAPFCVCSREKVHSVCILIGISFPSAIFLWSLKNVQDVFLPLSNCPRALLEFLLPYSDSYWILIQFSLIEIVQMKWERRRRESRGKNFLFWLWLPAIIDHLPSGELNQELSFRISFSDQKSVNWFSRNSIIAPRINFVPKFKF
jgi:hypothetical protein